MSGLYNSIRRELRQLGSRRLYLWAMVLVPVGMALFFVSLLSEGLPERVPTAIVDLDNSSLSHRVSRSLNSQQNVAVTMNLDSYHDAMRKIQEGEIFGFFYIPRNFEEDALNGTGTTITYYTNMTYFVPGTLAYKAFKSMAVMASGGIVQTQLTGMGVPEEVAGVVLDRKSVV